MASSPALAINGALFVSVTRTSHSLDTPDMIAIMLFKVVMMPNMLLELVPALSIWRLLNSVTIQLSKALYIRLVLRPPKTRPKNRTGKLGTSVEKHDMEEVTQNNRHAVRRPCLSANEPTKYAEMAPEPKPVTKRSPTILSWRPNWSLYKLYTYGPE